MGRGTHTTGLALLIAPWLAFATGAGCADDAADSGGGSGTEGSGDGDGDGDAGGSESSGGSDGGGEPVDNEPARAVQISLVEANPGVTIPIARDGVWVGPSGRNGQIIKNRDTMIRVYLDVEDDIWIQRDIEGRLELFHSDGTTETVSVVNEIAQDSSTNSFQSNLIFGLVADQVRVGTEFQVTLWETTTGFESLPEVAEAPRAIADGPDQIGIQPEFMQMKVVLVPVDYTSANCTALTDTSEENLARYSDLLFEQNPLESLEIQVHSPLVVNDLDLATSSGFNTLASRVAQLRANEAPAPNVYYYGLFDNCGQCISTGDGTGGTNGGCLLGVARGIPGDSMGEASGRSSIGTSELSGNLDTGPETFVHEVGHTQGRRHVQCPNADAGGPDPSYPHEGGAIGVWGFGIRSFKLYHPTASFDYMSYCSTAWVSDWQWRATFDRIATLSSWDSSSWNPDGRRVLVGDVDPNTGEGTWWTEQGWIDDHAERSTTHEVSFLGPDGSLGTEAARVQPWTDGVDMVTVTVPLPDNFANDVAAIEYRDGAHVRSIPVSRVALDAGLKAR